jgi:hypothetical protein
MSIERTEAYESGTMTLSIIALGITTLCITIIKRDSQHNNTQLIEHYNNTYNDFTCNGLMLILIILYTGEISYNDNTYKWFYLNITSLIIVNKKYICNKQINNVLSKVTISKVVSSIVVLSAEH